MWFNFPDWRDKITHIGTDYIYISISGGIFGFKTRGKKSSVRRGKTDPSHRPLKINGAAKKYSTRDLVILIILGILQPAMFDYRKVSEKSHGLAHPVTVFQPWTLTLVGDPPTIRRHGLGWFTIQATVPRHGSGGTTNQVGFIFRFFPQKKHEKSESGGDWWWFQADFSMFLVWAGCPFTFREARLMAPSESGSAPGSVSWKPATQGGTPVGWWL